MTYSSRLRPFSSRLKMVHRDALFVLPLALFVLPLALFVLPLRVGAEVNTFLGSGERWRRIKRMDFVVGVFFSHC